MIDLTVGELKELFVSLMPKNATPTPANTGKNLVYGIKGIMELLHCSETTAYRLKSGVLQRQSAKWGERLWLMLIWH